MCIEGVVHYFEYRLTHSKEEILGMHHKRQNQKLKDKLLATKKKTINRLNYMQQIHRKNRK